MVVVEGCVHKQNNVIHYFTDTIFKREPGGNDAEKGAFKAASGFMVIGGVDFGSERLFSAMHWDCCGGDGFP